MRQRFITGLERLTGVLAALCAVAIAAFAGHTGYHAAGLAEGLLQASVILLGGLLMLVAVTGGVFLAIDIHENLNRLIASQAGNATTRSDRSEEPDRTWPDAAPTATAAAAGASSDHVPVFSTRAMPTLRKAGPAPDASPAPQGLARQDMAKAPEEPAPSMAAAPARPRLVAERRLPR